MDTARHGLLAAYESMAELAKRQADIIDRLFRALSQVADVASEDLEAIAEVARMREEAEENGFI